LSIIGGLIFVTYWVLLGSQDAS